MEQACAPPGGMFGFSMSPDPKSDEAAAQPRAGHRRPRRARGVKSVWRDQSGKAYTFR